MGGVVLDVSKLTITETRALLADRKINAQELINAFLSYIRKTDGDTKAFINVTEEQALMRAKKIDDAVKSGKNLGPLSGVPMGVKDNICTKDIKTTCASKMLDNFLPPYNATVVERLHDAGAITLGKLNMDEFAMGSSTENSYYFKTKNPWDGGRVPGGSSGGSAAAVASGQVVYSLGSDTGGSIRQPAAFCGVVGLKPSYGRVSRWGLVAFAPSMDQVGPITKNVRDCALVLNNIAGHDSLDTTSMDCEVPDYERALVDDIKGLRVGIPEEFFGKGTDPAVIDRVERAIGILEEQGAICEKTTLPNSKYALPVYYVIATCEASSGLARFDGVRFGCRSEAEDLVSMYKSTRAEGFGPEVKFRILLGTYLLGPENYDKYYTKALKVRTLIRDDFERAFKKYDILVSPTTPTTAFKFGERMSNPAAMRQSDLLTIPANMAGIPAITVPCGLVEGMPVGMQIMGRPFGEKTLLRAAYTYECHRGCDYMTPTTGGGLGEGV